MSRKRFLLYCLNVHRLEWPHAIYAADLYVSDGEHAALEFVLTVAK